MAARVITGGLVRLPRDVAIFAPLTRCFTSEASGGGSKAKKRGKYSGGGALADRQKLLEKLTDEGEWSRRLNCAPGTLPPSHPFIVRIDGHKFSTLCRKGRFRQPFDVRMHNAMLCAARDSLVMFTAAAAYTFSDEISLLFAACPPAPPGQKLERAATHIYKGRIAKLSSLAASYVSARFNHHLAIQSYGEDHVTGEVSRQGIAHFDARAVVMPSAYECLDYTRWRQIDCLRNSKSHMGHAYLNKKTLDRVSADEVVRRVEKETGHSWLDTPYWFREGVLLKKQQFEKVGVNEKTGREVPAVRSRVVACNALLTHYDDEHAAVLLDKYVEDDSLVVGLDPKSERTTATTSGPAPEVEVEPAVFSEMYRYEELVEKSVH